MFNSIRSPVDGGIGQRKCARIQPSAHRQIDVLTCLKLHRFVQTIQTPLIVGVEVLNAFNHAVKIINRQVKRIGIFVNIRSITTSDWSVAQQPDILLLALIVHQCEIRA